MKNQYRPSLLFSISCLTLSPQKEYLLMTLSYKIFMVHGNFPKYDASLKKVQILSNSHTFWSKMLLNEG